MHCRRAVVRAIDAQSKDFIQMDRRLHHFPETRPVSLEEMQTAIG